MKSAEMERDEVLPKLTVNLSPELHRRVRIAAAEDRTTIANVVRTRLEEWLEERNKAEARKESKP